LRQFLRFFFLIVTISGISCTAQISWESGDPWDDDYYEEKRYPEIPDIYERSVSISFEEADLMIRSALEEENFKIIKVAHVSEGMKEQGRTDFWEDMHIYMVCKLSDGYFILRHNPQLVGFCPYRIYTYRNKEGDLVIGMVKPSLAVKYMGNPDSKAVELLRKHDIQLKKIIDEITSK